MKILLTGCAGFIGANFVKKICTQNENKNYEFVILDALTYSGRYQTIEGEVTKHDNIHFFEGDIRNEKTVTELFNQYQFDGVIHFAAESHVDRSIENPNIFVETNVLGTLNLLNQSLKMHEKNNNFKFVHVSTDEVYGQLSETDPAFTEETPFAPNSPYSASKASSDLMVRAYNETYGLHTVTTRCSNNYGAYQFPEKLIPLMIDFALHDKKLPVYGDGKNIRDWIYVEDHNQGVWDAFQKGKSGHAYNFGGDAERRNIDVVKTILDIVEKPHDLITFVEDRKGHDWRYAMDFTKAKNELGWTPKVSFEEGIKKTVNWYLENRDWIQMIKDTCKES